MVAEHLAPASLRKIRIIRGAVWAETRRELLIPFERVHRAFLRWLDVPPHRFRNITTDWVIRNFFIPFGLRTSPLLCAVPPGAVRSQPGF